MALDDPVYEDIASKFFEHFVYISHAMNDMAGEGIELWDPRDGFFYDVLLLPDGRTPSPARALHGRPDAPRRGDDPGARGHESPPHVLAANDVVPATSAPLGEHVVRVRNARRPRRWLLSSVTECDWSSILARMLDEERVPVALRHPLALRVHRDPSLRAHHRRPRSTPSTTSRANPPPGSSAATRTGGDRSGSPLNYLIIKPCSASTRIYGRRFHVECPTGSGQLMSLAEVARELSRRLTAPVPARRAGRRPVHGPGAKFRTDRTGAS